MSRERDRSHPTDPFGLPEGLLAAIVAALVLIIGFAVVTAATPMPPAEYWAALTTFALLTLGATLLGSAALYDALGRTVRRDWRALAVLVALFPALYIAYASAVRELTLNGAFTALAFAAVPALAFGAARGSRTPTLLDFVALAYLGASLLFGLVPSLGLPQQGGGLGYFLFALLPLLLLLFAWRGWPGLGYSWHLSWRELLIVLAAGLVGAALMQAISILGGDGQFNAGINLLLVSVALYFFFALPIELLLRGGVQNGLERLLRERLGPAAGWIALAVSATLTVLIPWVFSNYQPLLALYGLIPGIVAGLAYKFTGKVTASAVTSTLTVLPIVLQL